MHLGSVQGSIKDGLEENQLVHEGELDVDALKLTRCCEDSEQVVSALRASVPHL